MIDRLRLLGVVAAVPPPTPEEAEAVVARWQAVRRSQPVEADAQADAFVWMLDRYFREHDSLSPIAAWRIVQAEVWPLGVPIDAAPGAPAPAAPPAPPSTSTTELGDQAGAQASAAAAATSTDPGKEA
jgi:hypothetical protein